MPRPDIEAIKRRLAKATPGIWTLRVRPKEEQRIYDIHANCIAETHGGEDVANARLIVHASGDLRSLIAYVEDLEDALRDAGLP